MATSHKAILISGVMVFLIVVIIGFCWDGAAPGQGIEGPAHLPKRKIGDKNRLGFPAAKMWTTNVRVIFINRLTAGPNVPPIETEYNLNANYCLYFGQMGSRA